MVSMKKKLMLKSNNGIVIIFAIVLFLGSFASGSNEQSQGLTEKIKWSTSYQDSIAQAKLENKPVLIKFTASWCVYCQKMKEEVFTEPEIIKELGKFVCVEIDIDKNEDVARAYKIKSIPRTIVVNVYDEIVGDWLGFREASVYSKLLKDIDEYTFKQIGTTSAPSIQQTEEKQLEVQEIPKLDPNDTDNLVGLLGNPNAGISRRAVELLVEKGIEILPQVASSLESNYLGTRIAAWKVFRQLTRNKYQYDPWASKPERVQASKAIIREIQSN